MIIEVPDTFADITKQFSAEEMQRLTAMLNDPVFLKLEARAELGKPKAKCSASEAVSRISEIHGWELRRAALFVALLPPREQARQTPESFQPVMPDAPDGPH